MQIAVWGGKMFPKTKQLCEVLNCSNLSVVLLSFLLNDKFTQKNKAKSLLKCLFQDMSIHFLICVLKTLSPSHRSSRARRHLKQNQFWNRLISQISFMLLVECSLHILSFVTYCWLKIISSRLLKCWHRNLCEHTELLPFLLEKI